MFGEIRESTGGTGEGMVEGEVVEEMRKNEGQGAQDRNKLLCNTVQTVQYHGNECDIQFYTHTC